MHAQIDRLVTFPLPQPPIDAIRSVKASCFNYNDALTGLQHEWFAPTSQAAAAAVAAANDVASQAPPKPVHCTALMAAALHGRAAVIDCLAAQFGVNFNVQASKL